MRLNGHYLFIQGLVNALRVHCCHLMLFDLKQIIVIDGEIKNVVMIFIIN